MASRIRIRRGTTAQWNSSNKILESGELGIDTTLNKIKAGNGTSLWSALPYLTPLTSEVQEIAQDAVDAALVAGTGITKSYNDTLNTITVAVDSTIANKTYVDESVASLSTSASEDYIPFTLLGQADGVATLDENGRIPISELGNLIDGAPNALDTLNELAAAINDDSSYAATITTALSTKITATSQDILKNKTISISNGITSVSGYDNIEGFFGQNNIVIFQDGVDKGGKINISSGGVITVASSGLGYQSGLAIIGGGTRILIEIGGNTLTGTLAQFNASLTDADFATQSELNTKLAISEPAVDYYITNAGMGSYMINGVSNGTIHFERGKKYRILVNAPGHPFWIQTVSGGYSVNDLYSTGISGAGTDNGSILVELPSNAPQLYYACQYHPSMAGSIFTGNVNQTYKSLSGLSNVDNTSDDTKALISYIAVSGSTRTINSATDKNKLIECSNACTITIPNDTQDAGWPVGSMVEIRQVGSGQVTVTKDAAVTMQGTDSQFKSRVQWSTIMLEKRGPNSWLVTGDTTA